MHLDAKQFYYTYDLDSTSYKYGRLGDATGMPVQGKYGLTASGSSTTVLGVTSMSAFAPVNVGDILVLVNLETNYIRKVITKVSNDEITVDSNVANFTAKPGWYFYPFKIGTTINDGWHAAQAYSSLTLLVKLGTVAAAGGIDISIEGKAPNIGGLAVQLFTKNYAAGSAYEEPIVIAERTAAIRVGVKGGSGFSGTDAITISMVGQVGRH